MTDSKALIERLRATWANSYNTLWNPDGPEAADHIEKLEADNARLRETLQEVMRLLSYASQDAVNEAAAQSNKNMAWQKARAALQEPKP